MFSRRHDLALLHAGFERRGDESWAVIADELQAQGAPRGELIAVEQRLDTIPTGPERHALEATRARNYEQHGRRWLGSRL